MIKTPPPPPQQQKQVSKRFITAKRRLPDEAIEDYFCLTNNVGKMPGSSSKWDQYTPQDIMSYNLNVLVSFNECDILSLSARWRGYIAR